MTVYSDNVLSACRCCGGGPGGFMVRTGANNHAPWCEATRATMTPVTDRHVLDGRERDYRDRGTPVHP